MPIQKLDKYKCDLCGQEGGEFATKRQAEEAGWLHLTFENYYLDRDFFHRCVGPHCAKELRPLLAKKDMDINFDGIWAVYLERNRQRVEKGISDEHDDDHKDGSLAVIAASLAVDGTDAHVVDVDGERGTPLPDGSQEGDRWGILRKHGYRGTKPDQLHLLAIAGALICAEYDRVKRRMDAEAATEVVDG